MLCVRRLVSAVVVIAMAVGAPVPASAHHTFVTKYDSSKKITITGTISSVSYSNPHIHFTVETSNGASWNVETEGIAVVQKHGITRDVLKDGAKVTVTGWKGRDGSATLGLSSISFANGPQATIRKSAR